MISNPHGLLVTDSDKFCQDTSMHHSVSGHASQNSNHTSSQSTTSNTHSLPHHHSLAQNFPGAQSILPQFIQATTQPQAPTGTRSDRSTPVWYASHYAATTNDYTFWRWHFLICPKLILSSQRHLTSRGF